MKYLDICEAINSCLKVEACTWWPIRNPVNRFQIPKKREDSTPATGKLGVAYTTIMPASQQKEDLGFTFRQARGKEGPRNRILHPVGSWRFESSVDLAHRCCHNAYGCGFVNLFGVLAIPRSLSDTSTTGALKLCSQW